MVVVDEEEEKERGLLIHCAKENPWEMRRGERVRRENGVNEIIARKVRGQQFNPSAKEGGEERGKERR